MTLALPIFSISHVARMEETKSRNIWNPFSDVEIFNSNKLKENSMQVSEGHESPMTNLLLFANRLPYLLIGCFYKHLIAYDGQNILLLHAFELFSQFNILRTRIVSKHTK